MQRSSRAPVLSATRRRDSCWITEPHHLCRSCPMGTQAGGWQGRRARSYLERTGATEDAASHRPARPSGCELCGWRGSLGRFHHLGEAPVLRLRERARLDDPDDVPHLRLVLLVVRVELRRPADDLLVARVRLDRVDLDDDRLVHRARDDDAAPLLSPAALVL